LLQLQRFRTTTMATASVAPSYRSSFDCWSGIWPAQLAANVWGEGVQQQQRRYSL
jgi:hypothetical protein